MNIRSLHMTAKVASILAAMAFSGQTFAADGSLTGSYIARVLLTSTADNLFGGCMVNLTMDPKTVPGLEDCGAMFLTLNCDGVTGTSTVSSDTVRAYRMLDQAQLALATNKKTYITFTNSLKKNGYCSITRLDVIK
jgi:hypothetical protein